MPMLIHNLIGHPIAGILWAIGAEQAGNWIHDATLPASVKQEQQQ